MNDLHAEQVILNGALASRADNNDTIDLAVLGGLKDKEALKGYEVVHFQPFDPVHKRTEATVKATDGSTFKVTKGAPQVILKLAANAASVKDAVDKAVNDFAARGFAVGLGPLAGAVGRRHGGTDPFHRFAQGLDVLGKTGGFTFGQGVSGHIRCRLQLQRPWFRR